MYRYHSNPQSGNINQMAREKVRAGNTRRAPSAYRFTATDSPKRSTVKTIFNFLQFKPSINTQNWSLKNVKTHEITYNKCTRTQKRHEHQRICQTIATLMKRKEPLRSVDHLAHREDLNGQPVAKLIIHTPWISGPVSPEQGNPTIKTFIVDDDQQPSWLFVCDSTHAKTALFID